MKCPTCIEEDKKSKVYEGLGVRTAMGIDSFYDEDGKHHYHDPNSTSVVYHCSEGHAWSERQRSPCWCGWGEA